MAAQTSHRKRPATIQTGPAPKKVHLEKTDKKRSRPITMPIQTDSSSDDEVVEESVNRSDDVGKDNDEMVVDGGSMRAKDPNCLFLRSTVCKQRDFDHVHFQPPVNHINRKKSCTPKDVLRSRIRRYCQMQKGFGRLCVRKIFQPLTGRCMSRS
jgi:hypothetical protein